MNILFLNSNIGYGGASKMIIWVANQCAERGHNVTVLTYRDGVENQNVSSKVNHIHVDLEKSKGINFGVLSTIIYLRRFIIQHEYDLAIAFLPSSQIRLSLACIGLKIKLLYSHRGDPYQRKKSIKMRFAESLGNLLFSTADYFVFQTEGAKQYYSKSIQNRSTIIPNPINRLERTKERRGNVENKIVCVARLDLYQKRQDILITAFSLIENNYPKVILELYGDGNPKDEAYLRKLASSHPQIKFMGCIKKTEIVSHIQNAAIAVLSSDFEGIPNALLEYMSLGIPSISTDCSPGGAATIIKNNLNGLLVPPHNPIELSKAIAYLLDNFDEAERMGREGQKVIEEFSESKICSMWMNVIHKLCS